MLEPQEHPELDNLLLAWTEAHRLQPYEVETIRIHALTHASIPTDPLSYAWWQRLFDTLMPKEPTPSPHLFVGDHFVCQTLLKTLAPAHSR